MRLFRHPRLLRALASLVGTAVAAMGWPAAQAQGASQAERAARLDAVLADPAAVRAALAASDASRTPEAAVAAFADAYWQATGETVPTEAIAEAVADFFLGRTLRPVPPPETKIGAAASASAGPTASAAGFAVLPQGAGAPPSVDVAAATDGRWVAPSVDRHLTPPARAP